MDANGASVAEYRYDAWGALLDESGTMASINPIRYRGYFFDQETGLYYLQSRYYDPTVGRFINADAFASTGQGILGANMFAYCLNNPVKNRDVVGGYTVTSYEYSSEYEDEYGYVLITGTIYIYKGNDIPDIYYYCDPQHRPEGYVEGRDVIVLDRRDKRDNPTMIIYNSYVITESTQKNDIIAVLLSHEKSDPKNWGRSQRSLLREWNWHNFFAPFSDEAKHTDFDRAEEGVSGWYYVKKAWSRFWGLN